MEFDEYEIVFSKKYLGSLGQCTLSVINITARIDSYHETIFSPAGGHSSSLAFVFKILRWWKKEDSSYMQKKNLTQTKLSTSRQHKASEKSDQTD